MLAAPTLLFALLYLPYLTLGGTVQKPGLVVPPDSQKYADRVKTIFTDSYEAYKLYAFGHDDVAPIRKGFSDGRNGWGATIVDAMSTMHIMGLNDLFTEAVNFASEIDFSNSKTPDTVSVFESTIRYVGGLLSAYELNDQKYPQLKTKAKELADKLAFAWVGANDVPFGHIDFSTNTPQKATSNIAEAGTLTLEWATLSKHTGNDTYRQLAEKSVRHIAGGGAPLPGLPGQGIDPASGLPVGGYVTWGGGSDSYFEYLIKYARLNKTIDPIFADSWRTAVDSSIRTLLKRSIPGNNAYLADFDDSGKIRHVSSHLACFHGGNWLFGGKLLDNQTIVDIGLQLVDSCWNTYASTSTGIGPEQFAFISDDGGYTGGNTASLSQFNFNGQHGFYITSPYYILRPEALESNFYAWRVTGDTKYLDRAALAITKFEKYLKVEETGGYAGLYDVDSTNSRRVDDTESFWYAEVLKYLYLTFDEPSHIDLDEYVFNTEAHPFKIPTVTADQKFGTGKMRQQGKPSKTVSGDLPQVSKSSKAAFMDLMSEIFSS
ncbi:glycoside hydrolase family 47 protein [Hebeloma cylindrosporum]|uniref:alpha-1,2-Mannosidase n=1 Tax=Hebeloma cylindrosporum TaxID=76867 RepID=A0A0C2Z0Z6_HEBCY|nr:glycoside hydrolase family 47 protein [Hebeloma cylindrosporum h7]